MTKISELLADCYLAGYLDTAILTINGEVYEIECKNDCFYVKEV